MGNETRSKCPVCNDGYLEKIVSDYSTFVKEGIKEVRIIVSKLERNRCSKCGEEYLPPDALDRINKEKYKKLDLLTPDELKMIREKLTRTQEEMADLLGVGKKSYFRWENGLSIQNKSMDRYIRLVAQNPENVLRLRELQGQEESHYDREKVAQYFQSIGNIEYSEEELVGQVGHEVEIKDELKEQKND